MPDDAFTSPRLDRLVNAAARIQQEIALERASLARLARLEVDCRIASERTDPELDAFVQRALHAIEEDQVVDRADIFGRVNRPDAIRARHLLMWVVRTHTGASYPTLGRLFGRDHTSVINACRRVDRSPRLTEAAHRITGMLHVTTLAAPA